jgi:hypothetical protein
MLHEKLIFFLTFGPELSARFSFSNSLSLVR